MTDRSPAADRAGAPERLPIRTARDVVAVRQAVRTLAARLGFSLVEQTKVVTAASELARNALDHGGGGTATLDIVETGGRRGLRCVFEDQGPGIPDIPRALTDGYSTGGGLGYGLGGARRLVSEFDLVSSPGAGTRVTIVRWK